MMSLTLKKKNGRAKLEKTSNISKISMKDLMWKIGMFLITKWITEQAK